MEKARTPKPQSLSARSHRKAADAAGSPGQRRLAVSSLAACRHIRSGPGAWQSASPQAGGRRAMLGAPSAQPRSVAPAAPGDDERALSLFETPARRHAKHSSSRPSTVGDSWQTMSMPSRPGTGAPLLPSLKMPQHRILSQTLGPQTLGPLRSPRGLNTNEISESSDDDENYEAFSQTGRSDGTRQIIGGGFTPRRGGVGPTSSWGFYDSDEDNSQRNPLGRRLQSSSRRSRGIDPAPSRPVSSWSPGNKDLTWSLNLSRQIDSREALQICPAWVFQRVNLRDLRMSGNSIREMSESLLQLQHLHVLKLDGNELEKLPTALQDLNCLQILDVSDNKLSELERGMALPPGLIEASFSANYITSLPEQMLARSRMLQVLNLSQNRLSSLPSVDWPVALPNLEHLDLKDNRLSEIAGSKILGIPNLCRLDLSSNKLLDLALFQDKENTSDSHMLAFSTRLSELDCSDNQITFPPPEIIKSGGQWVAEYVRRAVKFHTIQKLVHAIALLEESNTSPTFQSQSPRAVSPIPEDSSKEVQAEGEDAAQHREDQVEELKRRLEDCGSHTPEDLEQNKSLRLVATGTKAGSVSVLVKHISKLDGVQKGSQMQRRWKLEVGEKAVHLKVLEMRGSAFLAAQKGSKNKLRWASRRVVASNAMQMEMNQHANHMSRAIYIVAFRVFVDRERLAENERQETTSIIRAINRTGNVRVVVVPTVPSASDARHEQVQVQCCALRKQLQEEKLAHLLLDNDNAAVSLNGPDLDKLERLKDELHAAATSSMGYCELLPSFVFSLRERIAVAKDTGSKFLSWKEYKDWCALSGVPPGEDMLKLTTDLLIDLGDIKYFGSNIVYIDLAWIMAAVNSLTDIDCTKLVSFLADRSPTLAFLASKLVENGILHPRLVPFVWPSLHKSEGWPGVDSELIVCFWAQENQDGKGDGSKARAVATDKLSLEAAHAACLGLGYCFSEQSEAIPAPALQVLREFIKTCANLNDEDHEIAAKMRSWSNVSHTMSCVVVPALVNRSSWNDAACVDFSDSDTMTQEICMVHLPQAYGFVEFRETLALYECIRVSRSSTEPNVVKSTASKSPQTATASPRSPGARGQDGANVYDFERQLPLRCKHTIQGRLVQIDLSRRMSISMRRLKTDPANHVGFDALLGMPSGQEDMQHAERFQDELKNLPPALYEDGSIRMEHTIVIYRVSILSGFKAATRQTIASLVTYKTIERRIEYEKHLVYLLLSHAEGVEQVKLLLNGGSPLEFLPRMAEVYRSLPQDAEAITTRIGEGIKELDGYLMGLDVSHNPGLRSIPVQRLCEIKSLKFIECIGSPQVYGLPPEVAKLGGTSAMQYLKDRVADGKPSTELQIIVIGNGEAGKSSLINCVINTKDDTSGKIKEDDRTVGIDIKEWSPQAFEVDGMHIDPKGLTCRFLDLAGQQVYACTNQFFLVPRALYIIAWRVLEPDKAGECVGTHGKKQELEDMIVNWMDSLHVRVPGASIVMVCTHIDAAAGKDGKMTAESWAEVDLQCGYVEKIVRRKLAQIRSDAEAASVAPLDVYRNGRSVRVQCLEGYGIKHLRQVIIDKAHNLPWWRELIPASYTALRDKLVELRDAPNPRVWLKWDDYRKLAESCKIPTSSGLKWKNIGSGKPNVGRDLMSLATPARGSDLAVSLAKQTEFDIEEWVRFKIVDLRNDDYIKCNGSYFVPAEGSSAIKISTSFLSEMAVIKYFGKLDREAKPEDPTELLDTTVFICPAWIIDGLKGLIRHDRDTLLDYLSKHSKLEVEEQRRLLRQVNRLATYGICHSSIIPFLWPCGGGDARAKKYWQWLIENNKQEELRLWPGLSSKPTNEFAKDQDDYDRVVALLEGCDFLYKKISHRTAEDLNSSDKGAEYVAPVLLVHEAKMDARSFSEVDCPIRHEYTITGMGPGFFDRLLCRVQKAYSYVESSHSTGVFYDRALKVQMFLVDSAQARAKKTAPTKSERRPGASFLRIDQTSDFDTSEGMKSKLCVLASTRAQQEHIMSEVKDLGGFFPGMTIGPYPNKVMMDADLEAASKEPVHIRIVALSNHIASRVKDEMVRRDVTDPQAAAATTNLLWRQLRIDAGADGGKAYEETYMEKETRIVIICMERLGQAKWRPSEIESLRRRQDEYEAKYKHTSKRQAASNRKTHGTTKDEQTVTGTIVDPKLRSMCPQEPPVQSKVDQAECSHNRARDDKQRYPCKECVYELLKKGSGQEAMEKYCIRESIRDSINVRDHRSGTPSLKSEWSESHLPYIDELRDKANLQQRQGGRNSSARAVLKKIMDVLSKLRQAEQQLRRHVREEDREFSGLTHATEVSMALAQTLKEAVEKTVYFKKRYALLWTRLEVLQSHLCIEEQMPDVERLRDKKRALSYGITDMRRATDAMKGNRQKADSLAESESSLSEQLETLRELRADMSKVGEDLALEEKWMVYTEELMWHVRKDVKVIPLIMPGYFEDVKQQRGRVDFSCWWPERMEAMEHHALFTDLSDSKLFSIERPTINATEHETIASKNFSLLMDQINRCLNDWRGKPPPADVFEPPTEIPCYQCVSAKVKAPHMFQRKTVEDQLSAWQEASLKALVANGTLSDGVMQFSSAGSFRADHRDHEVGGLPATAAGILESDSCILRCPLHDDHRLDAADLLSTAVLFEAVPCPVCLSSQDLPPHTFNRKKCMEWFGDGNMQKSGSVTCPKCESKKRPCRMNIVDLISPQVFFSYNWGKNLSTQKLVVPLRDRVELSTDLLIWLDVGGGMGVGDNHKVAMYDGIKKATVIVIFLSDAYVNSPNCQREFLNSVRSSKYIVPVLIPSEVRKEGDASSDPTSPDFIPNSGWTGVYDPNETLEGVNKWWWHHVFEVIKRDTDGNLGPTLNDPDNPGKAIDWSFLSRFEPIDMREANSALTADSPQELTLVRRILSRFHRGDDIDHATKKKYSNWKKSGAIKKQLLKKFKQDDIASLTMDALRNIFEEIDTDGNGTINATEMRDYFKKMGTEIDDETAKALLDEADANHSGEVDILEFKGVLTELILAKSSSDETPASLNTLQKSGKPRP